MTGSGTECVYSTLNTYTGPSTIKANWDPNTINLYWYNDDTQTSSNTCNYDGSISLPATNPTKTGYTFAGWEVLGGVPAGYTMLQYIAATGTQYINTDIVPDSNTRVDYKIRFATGSTADSPIMGARVGSGNTNRFFPLAYSGTNGFRTVYGSTQQTGTIVFDADYEGSFQPANNVSIINGQSYSLSDNSFSKAENNKFLLFGTTGYGSNLYLSKGRIYYVKIYSNNTLVRNMVPAKNSSNVVGMYDTVSGTFFTNAGSGTFTAGPAIQ